MHGLVVILHWELSDRWMETKIVASNKNSYKCCTAYRKLYRTNKVRVCVARVHVSIHITENQLCQLVSDKL